MEPYDELEQPKWYRKDIPNKGWTCIDVDDLGDVDETCQWCMRQPIRYVHWMTHPEYPDPLGCGCICAGRMEGSLINARDREKKFKSSLRSREVWLNLSKWKVSQYGNRYRKTDDGVISLVKHRDGWKVRVVKNETQVYSTAFATDQEAAEYYYDGMYSRQPEQGSG